jgi:hypothetical protein
MEISSKVGKTHLNVSTCPLTAHRGNANGSVTGLRTRIAAHAGGDAAESLLPVIISTRAAAAEKIAAHGVVDVAALYVMTDEKLGSCTRKNDLTTDEPDSHSGDCKVVFGPPCTRPGGPKATLQGRVPLELLRRSHSHSFKI